MYKSNTKRNCSNSATSIESLTETEKLHMDENILDQKPYIYESTIEDPTPGITTVDEQSCKDNLSDMSQRKMKFNAKKGITSI